MGTLNGGVRIRDDPIGHAGGDQETGAVMACEASPSLADHGDVPGERLALMVHPECGRVSSATSMRR